MKQEGSVVNYIWEIFGEIKLSRLLEYGTFSRGGFLIRIRE